MLDLPRRRNDPDGADLRCVGKLKIGDQVIKIVGTLGRVLGRFDTSSWPAGSVKLTARLCDGWSLVSADVLEIPINH